MVRQEIMSNFGGETSKTATTWKTEKKMGGKH